jgi:hypothetical protein
MKNIFEYVMQLIARFRKGTQYKQSLAGEIRPPGELIAHKQPKPLEIYANDEINVADPPDALLGIHKLGGGEEAIRIAGSERNIAADKSKDGSVMSAIEGNSRQGESGSLEVCEILVRHMNQNGAAWDNVIDLTSDRNHREEGIDCKAFDGNRELNIQVTRVERKLWKELATRGQVTNNKLVIELANAMWDSIEEKSLPLPIDQRNNIVLALNAIDTPSYVLKDVIKMFKSKYGNRVVSFGYISVWVVGPSENFTHRLDM